MARAFIYNRLIPVLFTLLMGGAIWGGHYTQAFLIVFMAIYVEMVGIRDSLKRMAP